MQVLIGALIALARSTRRAHLLRQHAEPSKVMVTSSEAAPAAPMRIRGSLLRLTPMDYRPLAHSMQHQYPLCRWLGSSNCP